MDLRGQSVVPQAAAVPFRIVRDGRLEILLIRRRPGGGWGIPKGLVERGQTARTAALVEALEEAGLEGDLLPEPLGSFVYEKFGGTCRVTVFAMRVRIVHAHFLEEDLRERRWFAWQEAGDAARRRGVRDAIARLPAALAGARGAGAGRRSR